MRSIIIRLAASALVGPFLVSGALAEDGRGYPRVVGTGENASVEYGPGDHGNVVGGGRVTVVGSGDNIELRHQDNEYAQAPHPTMAPMFVGSGESQDVVWVPREVIFTAKGSPRANGR